MLYITYITFIIIIIVYLFSVGNINCIRKTESWRLCFITHDKRNSHKKLLQISELLSASNGTRCFAFQQNTYSLFPSRRSPAQLQLVDRSPGKEERNAEEETRERRREKRVDDGHPGDNLRALSELKDRS